MNDPLTDRARRAANSIRSATAGTEVPPINKMTLRASADRALGVAFVVTLISGLVVVGALAGTGRTGDDAAQGAATSTSSTSTSTSTTSPAADTTVTSVSGVLQDVWHGPGTLKIELLQPDSFELVAAADLTNGDEIGIHIQDDAQELAFRVRLSGTAAPGSTVLASGVPVVVDSNSNWSSEMDLTLHQDDRTVVVLEIDGLAYEIKISLDDDDPADHHTGTTLEPGHENDDPDDGDDTTPSTLHDEDDDTDDVDDTTSSTLEPGHDEDEDGHDSDTTTTTSTS